MTSVRFYLDGHGYPRADTTPCSALGSFLEQDIQDSAAEVQELIRIVRSVDAGETSSWEGTGNAFTLTLTPGSAHLYNEYAPEECVVSSDELISALEGWISFVSTEP